MMCVARLEDPAPDVLLDTHQVEKLVVEDILSTSNIELWNDNRKNTQET